MRVRRVRGGPANRRVQGERPLADGEEAIQQAAATGKGTTTPAEAAASFRS